MVPLRARRITGAGGSTDRVAKMKVPRVLLFTCAVAECPSLGTPGTYSPAFRRSAASCRCCTRRSFPGSRVLGRIRGSGCCLIRSARRFLRAEAICHFQPPLPPFRPWCKLWGRERAAEMPAIVGDLRNAAWSGLVGQRDTQILELVMDGFLDLNVALP